MARLSSEIAELFERDLKRLTEQIAAFPESDWLWKTVPGVSNPAGNLILHVEGNLREYIGRQLGHLAYQRSRKQEFGTKDLPIEELQRRIEEARRAIPAIIANLSGKELESPFPEDVFGRPLSTMQFLIHLHGHFNYHLGQIDYLRRMLTRNGAVKMAQL